MRERKTEETSTAGGGAGWAEPVGKRTLVGGLATPIMRAATGDAGPGRAAEAHVAQASQGSGAPLPAPLRGELEPALGADLSAVRVHTGAASAAASDALSAKAYAVGQDVHFGAGTYDPSSASGKHLIAHEVAHTVQQQGVAAGVQRSAIVSQPGDAAERQADSFACAFVAGASTEGIVTRGMAPSAQIHRYGRDEHADIPTTHLTNLYEYLRTPAGAKWAKDHGYKNPADLIRRMEADPVVKTYNEKPTAEETRKGVTERHVAKLRGKNTDFSYGEVTAMMGDLFGHWESLYNADETQREHLMGEDSTKSNEKYTKGEYLKLAAKNDTHFAGKNQEAWLDHHNQAIELAMTAKDDDGFNKALFIDAAGAHFLTDAFSAGHQFEKAVVFNAALVDVQKNFIQTDNKSMQTYVAIAGMNDSANIPNLIVKAIHDKLNLEGFEVVNGKGMKWRTYGDDHLDKSVETQRIAALAVFESRQQVIKAHSDKTPPPVKEVLDFFPTSETQTKATDYALGLIPWARQQVEQIIYAQRKEASVKLGLIGGYLAEHNLEAIGDPARERNILQQQDFDRQHGGDGGGVVMPQFEWRFGK